jgi:hypothetical protein
MMAVPSELTLYDLPLEVLEEILVRLRPEDMPNISATSKKLMFATKLETVWIRRCKYDYGFKVDGRGKEEGAVKAFYQLILHQHGASLGLLHRTNFGSYSGIYQMVYNGHLGLLCLKWMLPYTASMFMGPMTMKKFFRVDVEKVDGRFVKTCSLLDSFNRSTVNDVLNNVSEICLTMQNIEDIYPCAEERYWPFFLKFLSQEVKDFESIEEARAAIDLDFTMHW